MPLDLFIFFLILVCALVLCIVVYIKLKIDVYLLILQYSNKYVIPVIEKWTEIIKNRIKEANLNIYYHQDLGDAAAKYVYTSTMNNKFMYGNEIQVLEKYKNDVKKELFLLLHEYGHHHYLSKFNDSTEESADRYIRDFAKEMPVKEQYILEIYVSVHSGTEIVSNKIYRKMYLQELKKNLILKHLKG